MDETKNPLKKMTGELAQQSKSRESFLRRATRPIRSVAKALVFFLKLFPMIPSRPVDWVTKTPVIEKVSYPTRTGLAEGEIYRPPGAGPHPGLVVCLGVVPFGVDHPQVPVMGKALARAGFVALLYWSPAMRDFRLDPIDAENIALAYDWFIKLPYVDPVRSGLLGTCVGGSFALMAASQALIRDRVGFIGAYAPFSSMWTLARAVASATRVNEKLPEPWKVDQLTRKVFVHSFTAWLEPGEAERLRSVFADGNRPPDDLTLSGEGQSIFSLLNGPDYNEANNLLCGLPLNMQDRLTALTPMNMLQDIHAPLIVLLHDRGDLVIPVGESRRLVAALDGSGEVHYTEMQFSHLDPAKGKLPFFILLREFTKFFRAVLPMFQKAVI